MAYEPWETRVAARFLERLTQAEPNTEALLLIADPYQIRNNKSARRLKKLDSSESFSIEIVFRDVLQWQNAIRQATLREGEKALENLSQGVGVNRLEALLTSDPHLYPRERSPFYGSMSEKQKKLAGALVMEKTAAILRRFKPDVVVMMWDQYLVKNFVGTYCSEKHVPIRVFRRLRWGSHLKLDHFFLASGGPSDVAALPPQKNRSDAVQQIETYGNSLYQGNLAVAEDGFIQRCHTNKILATRETLKKGLDMQIRKLRTGAMSRPRSYRGMRLWASVPEKVHLYLFLKTLRTLRYIWGKSALVRQPNLPQRFVVVPLHFRPESAILTQGVGLEDDDVVYQVSEHLARVAPGVSCVVLEHPSMIEDRRQRFYKQFKDHSNVVFADPSVPTQWLIEKSLGVVTISGTVGLEASIKGIPVHVMGKPEFLRAIKSQGANDLPGFLESCANGNGPNSREGVIAYLSRYSFSEWQGEMGWASVQSEEALEKTADTLLRMFRQDAG